ncbi:MAG: dipeptide/oligopeptide/nickel ABC transporter ATP-binding protein, partial [Rhodobacteraceae bacterium]|nr:dipeptide/oligopeptide/nickel ABC transporter ATP-binding protein [Paracoccaceae bacterium]
KKSGKQVLLGQPPNPANLPSGCAFAPRCVLAKDICFQTPPAIVPDGAGRLTACHRRDEISLTGVSG